MRKWLGVIGGAVLGAVLVTGIFMATSRRPTPKALPAVSPSASAAAQAAPATEVPELDAPAEAPRPSSSLPADAPKAVTFGVILISYAGADFAPTGARSKADALTLATNLAQAAMTDFDGTVAKGDRGSTKDAGSLPQGVLDPATEYALFTLPVGKVFPTPLDTPRGFWVVRRIR